MYAHNVAWFSFSGDTFCLYQLKAACSNMNRISRNDCTKSQQYYNFYLHLFPLGKCGALHLGSFTSCVPVSLSFFLSFSGRKLEKSVNIDARTLKFCMNHPWTQSLRFRENQIVCMSLSLLVGLLPY